jgi:hypothetical protein
MAGGYGGGEVGSKRHFFWVLVGVVVLAPLVAAASPSAVRLGSRCRSAQLRGRMLDSTGAAGTVLVSITLRNVGAACWLQGYAGLRLANAHGLLPTRVVHGGLAVLNQRPNRVVLGHGRFATLLVAYNHLTVGHACPQSTRLLVRPPRQPGWVTVAVAADACNHGRLEESPLLTGIHHA